MDFRKKRRFFRDVRADKPALPLSLLLMIAAYLFGCLIGCVVAIRADAGFLTNLQANSVDSSSRKIVSAFCVNSSYGFFLLY